jgi:beta-lactamase class D
VGEDRTIRKSTGGAMDRLSNPLAALFATLAAGTAGADFVEQPRWKRHFDAKGVQGTFVLFEPLEARYRVWDAKRARKGYPPQSTFKIPNAIVGLEVGAINDELEVFRWDGKPKPVVAWERDHDLASGMTYSVVWMFQEVARRIGRARMKEWLDRLEYGNRDISGGIDLFWLQGGLRVSAMEQVAFLHRLAEGRLPATQRAQRLVRGALVVERTSEYTLHAKTGTSSQAIKDPVWWWVGWVERKGRPHAYFALNFTPHGANRFTDRFEIGRAILEESGALPPG